ncbi:MAG: mannose-6-phosphate isomerase [Pseudohongiellaceae bacterium]|jgi:mannose-6-phosphate isomerase
MPSHTHLPRPPALTAAATRVTHPVAPSHLSLEPLGVPRPWGGREIARRFGWDQSAPCGEWWLLSTYPGAVTKLRHGQQDLSAWLAGTGRMFGWPDPDELPLLLKLLDAREPLSVQVHPDDAAARSLKMPRGKSEAWHIISAEPDAVLYLGLAEGVRAADLLAAIVAGASSEQIIPFLAAQHPRPGDTYMVDAGTVHAIGGGLTLFEVQQTSDAIWRLHDWDRLPALELHTEEAALSLADTGPVTPIRVTPSTSTWTTLVDGSHFSLARSQPAAALALTPRGPFATVTVLAGNGELFGSSGAETLRPGDTVMVAEAVLIEGTGLDLLRCEPGHRGEEDR